MATATQTWFLIATDAGVVIQKTGAGSITLAYKASVPVAGDDTFGITDYEPRTFPKSAGSNIYVKAFNDTSYTAVAV